MKLVADLLVEVKEAISYLFHPLLLGVSDLPFPNLPRTAYDIRSVANVESLWEEVLLESLEVNSGSRLPREDVVPVKPGSDVFSRVFLLELLHEVVLQYLLYSDSTSALPVYAAKGLSTFFEDSAKLEPDIVLHDHYEMGQAEAILVDVLTTDWGVRDDLELTTATLHLIGLPVLQLNQ